MFLTNWPMYFRGTIKGISPEQAKQIFNYNMPPDAKGISFCIRNNKTRIFPYYPEKYANLAHLKNPIFALTSKVMADLNKITSQLLVDIIRPVWTIPAKEKNYESGYHLFISTNYKLALRGIENIVLTIGELETPRFSEIKHDSASLTLSSESPYEIGFFILNNQSLQIQHILPKAHSDTRISIPIHTKDSIVFAYYKQAQNYSQSIRLLPATMNYN
jgi:hypothetical protein